MIINFMNKKELIFEGYYLNDEKWNGKIKDYINSYNSRCCHRCGGFGFYTKSDIEIKNEKEYKNDILKFEGEYLNDKKNGKGKEYDINGKIIFEGEFLNGIQKSKRFKYKYDDYDYLTLEYEGEILEGKKHGKGKEYDYNNRIIFEGIYLKGKRWNGKVKKYDINGGIINEKEYFNGKIIGDDEKLNNKDVNYLNEKKMKKIAKEYFEESNKIRFEGEYLKDKKWNGIIYNKDDNFKIIIKNGNWRLNDSVLKFTYLGKDIYIIQDKNGIIKEYCNGLLSYEGEYLNDKRNGKGKEYDYSGKILFEGEYKNGERWNGKIKELIIHYEDEIKFEGEYKNGEK